MELDLDFGHQFSPENFFFGVANAPYLCEGGYNTPGGPWNSYGVLEKSGKIERSGTAVRFWTGYEEQIRLAASLGLDAFRMGIDWARVQPTTSPEPCEPPPWDEDALERYAQIVATVRAHGMRPIVTLHHFTHPAWLPPDMWLHDEGPDLLVGYELRVVEEINRRLVGRGVPVMDRFLVYNEPGLVPLIYHLANLFPTPQGPEHLPAAYDNMFSRYVRIYDGLRDLFEREGWGIPHAGFTTASNCAYELDKLFADVVRLRSFGVGRRDVGRMLKDRREAWDRRIDPLARSKLTDAQYANYRRLVKTTAEVIVPGGLPKTLDALYASPRVEKLDYLSTNVYEPFGLAKGLDDTALRPRWWEFVADPEIYHAFIHATNEANTGLPLYMGENSLAYRQPVGGAAEPRPDGWTRERYLKSYLMTMVRCMKEGVPIRGYLYWSLVDDFEWEAGYAPRLGLYNYDYREHRILPTDGLGEPAGEIYANLVSALRSGDKDAIQKAFATRWQRKNPPNTIQPATG